MTNMKRVLTIGFASFCVSVPALAGSHTWRFSEVFSNPTGTIQFIELKCDINGENFVGNLHISTTGLDQNNNPIPDFVFPPGNLPGLTGNKKLLLGTAAFDNLLSLQPGAPHVDYIIPNRFVPINGGTLWYNPTSNYDKWVYGAGVIPTDGINSVQFTSFLPGNGVDTFTTDVNNPANYLGGGGSVNAACIDLDGDGYGNPGAAACPNGSLTDCNDNNPNAHPNGTENDASNNCKDGADNDCDGQTDCADSACATVVPECVPTVSEWGVLVLALLTLNAGSVMLRQRA